MEEEQVIKFTASLPTNSNAITFKGDGSAKISLELSSSELAKILPLTLLGETALEVTIKPQ